MRVNGNSHGSLAVLDLDIVMRNEVVQQVILDDTCGSLGRCAHNQRVYMACVPTLLKDALTRLSKLRDLIEKNFLSNDTRLSI